MELPAIMGILNLNQDSFYSKSRIQNIDDCLVHCEKMLKEGAKIIDVGAISSRPKAKYPGTKEELSRLMSIFPMLRKSFPKAIFSIDTWNAKVAKQMLEEGADIINDISAGLLDTNLPEVIAHYHCPYIIMHMKGNPENMQNLANYDKLIHEINLFFTERLKFLHQKGINDIVIDPGFGFSKTVEQNFELLNNLQMLKCHNSPVLVGLSRKSMIYKTLNCSPEEALNGSSAAHGIALMKGASILRVHDVKEAVEVLKILNGLW